MSKIALAAIAGALAILATPASAQNHGHSQGHRHAQHHVQHRAPHHVQHHVQHHRAHHQPVHHAFRQPAHHGHVSYAPTYHAPRYVPVVTPHVQPTHCTYVLQQHGYTTQKVLVCKAHVHQVSQVEAPAVVVEAAPIEAVPQK